jgi:DNA-binding IscR family transcriptional regulator
VVSKNAVWVPKGRAAGIGQGALAARHRLPLRHLEPVLQALVRDGILKGIRGPQGGYALARERNRIPADDILREPGPPRTSMSCRSG